MQQKGFHRKLTAILSADVAGYSRLMQNVMRVTPKFSVAIEEKMFPLKDEAFRKRLFEAYRSAGLK
jgi:hypothetical protein